MNVDNRIKITNLSSEENAIMKNNFEEVKGLCQGKENRGKTSSKSSGKSSVLGSNVLKYNRDCSKENVLFGK